MSCTSQHVMNLGLHRNCYRYVPAVCVRGATCIVEVAEAHGHAALSVMTWRPHDGCSIGHLSPARQDSGIIRQKTCLAYL